MKFSWREVLLAKIKLFSKTPQMEISKNFFESEKIRKKSYVEYKTCIAKMTGEKHLIKVSRTEQGI